VSTAKGVRTGQPDAEAKPEMKRLLILLVALALGLTLGPTAVAGAAADEHSDNMSLVGRWDDNGTYREGSDLAFWGNTAVLGRYNGMELLDISRPDNPRHVGKLKCNGNQNDVTIWGTLAFISVDSPMSHDGCDSPAATPVEYATGTAWEGIRIIDVSKPSSPEQIATVYNDCGSHTHTIIPDLQHRDRFTGQPDPRVLLYSHSYPLGGQGVRCNAATQRKIAVVEVPLNRPTEARVINTPDVSPAVGCHDITIFLPRKLAGAACISESQIWDISDPVNPVILSRIRNPAMQIHHSSAFSWDGDVLVLGDEKGGAAAASGCNTSGSAPTGAMWFYDISDPLRPQEKGYFVPPQNEVSTMCTAHNFNVIPVRSDKRILTTSWYHGGTHVIDFTDPSNPKQLGYYKTKDGVRGTPWSSYWYNGHIYANNFDAGYVPPVPESRGLDVFRIDHPDLTNVRTLTRLNPQLQEPLTGLAPRAQGTPITAAQRQQAIARQAEIRAEAAPAGADLPTPFCVLQV